VHHQRDFIGTMLTYPDISYCGRKGAASMKKV
jgi:hypothetical protein